MHIPRLPQLPFLTREMTRFLNKSSLQLRFTYAATTQNPVTLRGFTRSGIIDREETTIANGVRNTVTIGIDDIPIMLSVVDDGNAFAPGECWASVTLAIDGSESIALCSGYVYQEKGITFPATNNADRIPGRGLITNVNSANPAAGSEATITVPVGEIWRVIQGTVTLVTDANVANRIVQLKINDFQTAVVTVSSAVNHTASLTRKYNFVKIGERVGNVAGTELMLPIPIEVWVQAEGEIQTNTIALQAGDDFGVMSFLVERFPGQS